MGTPVAALGPAGLTFGLPHHPRPTKMAAITQVAQNKTFEGTLTKYKFASASLGGLDTQFNVFLPKESATAKVPFVQRLGPIFQSLFELTLFLQGAVLPCGSYLQRGHWVSSARLGRCPTFELTRPPAGHGRVDSSVTQQQRVCSIP